MFKKGCSVKCSQLASSCLLLNVRKIEIIWFSLTTPAFCCYQLKTSLSRNELLLRISGLLHFFTKRHSEQCSRLNGYCLEEFREEFRTQPNTSAGDLEKIVKRFQDANYFCNKLYLRCLIGFEYTSGEYCSGNTQKAILRQFFLQNSNFNETGLYKRENLKENIIVKASF